MKKILKNISIIFLFFCSTAFSQVYLCPFASAQTYNTLDTGAIQNVYQSSYTWIYPSSGSITVTTGVITLTTALDATYPNACVYWPAGAWTGSTAGFYYASFSSPTAGIAYSNPCTGSGSTPLSPVLVTTGAGAYTQDTGAYKTGGTFTVPGNVMGANGKLYVEQGETHNATANAKYVGFTLGGQVVTAINITSNSASARKAFIINKGATNVQSVVSEALGAGGSSFLTIDTTVSETLVERFFLTTATDFIVRQYIDIQATR